MNDELTSYEPKTIAEKKTRDMALDALRLAQRASAQSWLAVVIGLVALAACGLMYISLDQLLAK